jgi:hypothetical protein
VGYDLALWEESMSPEEHGIVCSPKANINTPTDPRRQYLGIKEKGNPLSCVASKFQYCCFVVQVLLEGLMSANYFVWQIGTCSGFNLLHSSNYCPKGELWLNSSKRPNSTNF